MSVDTSGSVEYSSTPASGPEATACSKASFTSSAVAGRSSVAVKSVSEPSATGTRRAMPSNLPCMASSTRPVARAAPVEVGMMFTAAARVRRRSPWGPSTSI